MRKKRSAFTLFEIIVTVSVVGLLAVLGMLGVGTAMERGRTKTAETELNLLATGILQMAWDTGKWPNGTWRNASTVGARNEVWDLTGSALFEVSEDQEFPDWKGPYYEGSLEDPWGKSYFFDSDYKVDNVDRIVVGSAGPNGKGKNFYDEDNIYIFLDD